MEQFVKAIEIWVPGRKNLVLELGSAYYGDLNDFKKVSQSMSFAYDQGLPGKTWASGLPIVLTELDNSYFQRADAAKQANIVCGISLPIFCGEYLQAVVILFCGGDESVVGAMELWHSANNSHTELNLVDGYYGELEKFEWLSRRLTIMRGRGLPGSAWEQGRPIIDDDLGHSSSFLRASHAAEVGLTTGLAIPFTYKDGEVQILSFLSAKGTPIAKRFEIWMPDENGTGLKFDSGQDVSETDLAQKYADIRIGKGEGPIGEAWLSGRPLVATTDSDDEEVMMVLPVMNGNGLNSMVCLNL